MKEIILSEKEWCTTTYCLPPGPMLILLGQVPPTWTNTSQLLIESAYRSDKYKHLSALDWSYYRLNKLLIKHNDDINTMKSINYQRFGSLPMRHNSYRRPPLSPQLKQQQWLQGVRGFVETSFPLVVDLFSNYPWKQNWHFLGLQQKKQARAARGKQEGVSDEKTANSERNPIWNKR